MTPEQQAEGGGALKSACKTDIYYAAGIIRKQQSGALKPVTGQVLVRRFTEQSSKFAMEMVG